MNKTKKIILYLFLFILIFITCFAVNFIQNKKNILQGTGAILVEQPLEIKNEGETINKLQDALPYSTDFFTINIFDYKTAKFQVEFTASASAQADFNAWLEQSPFSAIPQKRFRLIFPSPLP